MAVDHSQTYKGFGIRAFGHRHRLRAIFRELDNFKLSKNSVRFCDIGCSNGFITRLIQQHLSPIASVGLDYDAENIAYARSMYPEMEFAEVNLNEISIINEFFDLVTCFETLEHVGNLENAIKNILFRISPGGVCLVSVPIEHGVRGFVKYLVKKLVFRYTVSELGISEFKYLKILFGGGRISESRSKAEGYGTHFGFDYRDVDDLLCCKQAKFTAYNKGMTRFYIIYG
jgi:2-polyprenyl-3-methyl-5-hydroxy-6-metoxy-1,4-benzoquinol methylase